VRRAVFVQVRLGSTRLHAKALLPLAGATIIEHVMRALRHVPADVHALLTDAGSADALRPAADGEGFAAFVGPEEDVLARFCLAARSFRVDEVMRATGDNPFTSPGLAASIRDAHERESADLSHYLGNPWGTGVEVVQASALFDAEREAAMPDEREHITTWLYRHRDRYRVLEPQAPAAALMPDARVTVDTAEDYERVRGLFEDLYHGSPIETEELVRRLGGPIHA
jgi:spore coat polysaccharide biosynthesis protein SpsF